MVIKTACGEGRSASGGHAPACPQLAAHTPSFAAARASAASMAPHAYQRAARLMKHCVHTMAARGGGGKGLVKMSSTQGGEKGGGMGAEGQRIHPGQPAGPTSPCKGCSCTVERSPRGWRWRRRTGCRGGSAAAQLAGGCLTGEGPQQEGGDGFHGKQPDAQQV